MSYETKTFSKSVIFSFNEESEIVLLRDRFKMNFYSSRLRRGVCFVPFLCHISEDMPCETRRAYAPSRAAFMTNFIMKRSLKNDIIIF